MFEFKTSTNEEIEPQEMELGDIMPDDAIITIWDGVDKAEIYEGIPFYPVNIAAHFELKECGHRGTVQETTLKEIREKFPSGIITVFTSSPLDGAVYQIGNKNAYKPNGDKWIYYAKTGGYS